MRCLNSPRLVIEMHHLQSWSVQRGFQVLLSLGRKGLATAYGYQSCSLGGQIQVYLKIISALLTPSQHSVPITNTFITGSQNILEERSVSLQWRRRHQHHEASDIPGTMKAGCGRAGFSISPGFCCNHQATYNARIQVLSSTSFPPSFVREHINLVAHSARSQGGRPCSDLVAGRVRRPAYMLAEKDFI